MAFLPRKLLPLQHHNEHPHMIINTITISHSPGPAPAPAPSPSLIQPSLSLPITPKLPFPLIPIHDEGFHTNVLRLGMIIMASTLGIMMILCTVSLIRRSCCSRRRRNAPILFHVNGDSGVLGSDFDDDEGALVHHPVWFIRTVGLQQSVIDSITVFVYRKGERLIDGTECSVCLGEFQENDTLRLLPKCSHAFHVPCIDTWLRSHQNCPLCRAPILSDSSAATPATRTEMIVTEADSTASAENQEMENLDDGESSSVRITGDEDGEAIENMNMQRDVKDITEPVRRSVSMDSSSMICDDEDDFKIANSSSRIYKMASITFQKRRRSSFSHNRKCSSSTHTRSYSSSLPL